MTFNISAASRVIWIVCTAAPPRRRNHPRAHRLSALRVQPLEADCFTHSYIELFAVYTYHQPRGHNSCAKSSSRFIFFLVWLIQIVLARSNDEMQQQLFGKRSRAPARSDRARWWTMCVWMLALRVAHDRFTLCSLMTIDDRDRCRPCANCPRRAVYPQPQYNRKVMALRARICAIFSDILTKCRSGIDHRARARWCITAKVLRPDGIYSAFIIYIRAYIRNLKSIKML